MAISLRGPLLKFAEAMETKLSKHDETRGSMGWREERTSLRFLFDRMGNEICELKEAFHDVELNQIAEECVDVANFAMMIHDKIQSKKN